MSEAPVPGKVYDYAEIYKGGVEPLLMYLIAARLVYVSETTTGVTVVFKAPLSSSTRAELLRLLDNSR